MPEGVKSSSVKSSLSIMPSWGKIAVIGGLILVFLFVIMFMIFNFIIAGNKHALFLGTNTTKATSLSGSIGLNGAPPNGATIAIGTREVGDSSFTTVVSGITAVDGASWSWNDAEFGVAYEAQAYLIVNGNTVSTSDTYTAVAPADSEILHLTVPSSIAASPTGSSGGNSQSQVPSSISGTFNLNGYIPPGSTITINARQDGTNTFNIVQSGLSAVDNAAWSWTTALQNVSYELQATLVANGTNTTQSQVLEVTAPATNEVLTINSTLSPPVPATVTVSGSININGNIPGGSSISIGVRQTGTSTFNTVLSNIASIEGVTWSWNQASSGTSYDFQASLISNGSVVAQSQMLTTPAPANGELLTINAQTQPPIPPSNSMTNNCSGQNGSNQWQVTISYNNNQIIQGAQQYQLQIGVNTGDSSILNSTFTPNNPNQTQTYTTGYQFNTGQSYFARYAYSTCTNCNVFSPFSNSLQFYCNPQPTNTPTSTPTSTPVPTNTPVPTATSTPSPTPSPTTAPTNTPTPSPTNSPTPSPTNPAPTN